MSIYSQGICEDGAAILKNGCPMTPDEIVTKLNHLDIHIDGLNFYHLDSLSKKRLLRIGGATGINFNDNVSLEKIFTHIYEWIIEVKGINNKFDEIMRERINLK